MKAACYQKAKTIDILDRDVPQPGPGEVRIKVAYCGVCGTDVHVWHGTMDHRLTPPQPIGHEMSGTIDALGADVTGWAVGDSVTVRPLIYSTDEAAWGREGAHIRPGLSFVGVDTPGAFQEYWVVQAGTLHRLPEGIAMDEAALVEPLAVACHDVRLSDLKKDEFAVVLGGGPIGVLIGLVARETGARILFSEVNPHRLAMLRDFGFEAVDPRETDLEALVKEKSGTVGGADVVFEVTGAAPVILTMTKLAAVRGRIVQVSISPQPVPVDLFQVFWKELRIIGVRVYEAEDFDRAIELAARGDLPLKTLISKIVPLERTVEAFEAIDSGADLMKVLVQCSA